MNKTKNSSREARLMQAIHTVRSKFYTESNGKGGYSAVGHSSGGLQEVCAILDAEIEKRPAPSDALIEDAMQEILVAWKEAGVAVSAEQEAAEIAARAILGPRRVPA